MLATMTEGLGNQQGLPVTMMTMPAPTLQETRKKKLAAAAAAAAASTATDNDNDDAGTNDAAAGELSGDEHTLLFSTPTDPKAKEVIAPIKADPTALLWEATLEAGL